MKHSPRPLFLVTAMCAVAFVPSLFAQVINMSHDLVKLGIASQNATPNVPSLDSRPLIQATANYAQSHTVQTITLDKGNYYLLSATQGNATFIFGGLSNITVDFVGSTLYFQGPLLPNGISVYECTNFVLTNFNIDFLIPPYTHAKITSVDTQNRILNYQTLAGWPDPSSFNNVTEPFGGPLSIWGAVFRNGSIVPGTTRMVITGPITGNQIVLTQDGTPWTQSSTLATLQAGDTAVVGLRGSGPPLLVWWSDSVTLSNINLYGVSERAVSLHESTNSTVDNVRVEPRPGVGLIGSTGDGIHFEMTRQNNHIRNCYVTRTMDDGLIMDSGDAAIIANLVSSTEILVQREGYVRFPNTAMNFVDPITTLEFTGATIATENPPDSDQPAYNGAVDVTFQQDLPTVAVGQAMVIADPNLRGHGSTIEDSTVEDTYGGRAIWLNGVVGVAVQRNVIRRSSLGGIVVSEDTEAYPSPPAHDIVIQDNVLEGNLAPAANGTGSENALASIQVVSSNNQDFAFATSSSNTNISLLRNYIADSGRSGIWVGETNVGSISNNLVARWNEHPELPIWGIPSQFVTQVLDDFASAIVTHYNTGVTSSNNTTDSSNAVTEPVTVSPPLENVTWNGATGSFAVTPAIADFSWSVKSDSDWLTVTSSSPLTGNGTVEYSVAPNAGTTFRTGHIVVAGTEFTVTQSAGATLPSRPPRPTRPGNSGASALQANLLRSRLPARVPESPQRISPSYAENSKRTAAGYPSHFVLRNSLIQSERVDCMVAHGNIAGFVEIDASAWCPASAFIWQTFLSQRERPNFALLSSVNSCSP